MARHRVRNLSLSLGLVDMKYQKNKVSLVVWSLSDIIRSEGEIRGRIWYMRNIVHQLHQTVSMTNYKREEFANFFSSS